MIYKRSTLLKISKVAENLEAFKEHVELPTSVIEDKKGNFVYAWARAVTADVENGNGDLFPLDEIKNSYQTFVGRNMFLDHKADSVANAVGKVIAAKLMHDEASNEFYVGCLIKVCRDTHPQIAANLENGIIDSVSMGASVERCKCNVCGCEAVDPSGFCQHLRTLGKVDPATGKKHISINSGITFTELSFVSVPADKSAKIKKIFENATNIVKTASSNVNYKLELTYDVAEVSKIASHKACFDYVNTATDGNAGYFIKSAEVSDNKLILEVTNVNTDLNKILSDISAIVE